MKKNEALFSGGKNSQRKKKRVLEKEMQKVKKNFKREKSGESKFWKYRF